MSEQQTPDNRTPAEIAQSIEDRFAALENRDTPEGRAQIYHAWITEICSDLPDIIVGKLLGTHERAFRLSKVAQ